MTQVKEEKKNEKEIGCIPTQVRRVIKFNDFYSRVYDISVGKISHFLIIRFLITGSERTTAYEKIKT